jgi:putative tricarboxylic transport membrane protein
LGGHVDVASISVGPSISYLEAKKIRALAVTSEKRLGGPVMKDVATAKEQGADAVYPIWRGVVGPPEMPEDAVKYLQDAFTKMAKTKAWEEALEKRQWIDSFDTSGFKAFLDKEFEKNKVLLDKLGLLKK